MSGAQGINIRIGDLWVISSTLFWAVHVLLVGIMASRTRAPLVVAVTQFLVCGTAGLIVGWIIEQPTLADFLGAFYGICYVGIFSVGMAFTLQVVGQRFTPAADAAIILSSETVFAALAGFLFLDERLSAFRMFGAALILFNIIAVELMPMLRKTRPLS
jgi:drug/metabolite transporter (DMT)-like permease